MGEEKYSPCKEDCDKKVAKVMKLSLLPLLKILTIFSVKRLKFFFFKFEESMVFYTHCIKEDYVDEQISFNFMVTQSVYLDNCQDVFLRDDIIEYFLRLIDEISILPRKDDDAKFTIEEDDESPSCDEDEMIEEN